MSLSPEARARGLDAALAAPLWIGLATAVDAGALVEIDDPAYQRQSVRFGPAALDGEAMAAINIAPVQFPPLERDLDAQVRYFFLARSPAGEGELVAFEELAPSDTTAQGESIFQKPRAGVSVWFGIGDVRIMIS